MKRQYLLTPGPTPIPPQVSQAEARPIIHHRTNEFMEVYKSVAGGLKEVFFTKEDVYMLASSGTGAMECAVANLVSPGDDAIVGSAGNFGKRWVQLIQIYKGNPIILDMEWGKVIDLVKMEDLIKKNPKAKTIWVQFTETSTGVVNDIKALGKLARDNDRMLVVDAISGLGGQEFRMDEWNVDCAVAGSQKGLMLAPGLAFISLNKRAWDLAEKCSQPVFYFSLKKLKKAHADAQTPFTPAVTLIVALDESLKVIKSYGIENIWKRTGKIAVGVRNAFKAMGLELFGEAPCDVLTSCKVPEGVEGGKIVKRVREDFGISIAGGQDVLKGKIIRLAHMGYINEFDVIVGVAGLEIMLNKMGFKVALGSGVAEVERVVANG